MNPNDNFSTMGGAIPSQQAAKPRGWWSRNWKWFVPTTFILFVLICCGGPVGLFFGAVGIMRNSDAYTMGMKQIQANPQVKEALGEDIREVSWMPAGKIEIVGDGGNAELRWDLAGTKGNGKAYVKARRTNGKWEIVVIEVTPPDGKKIVMQGEGAGNDAPKFQGDANPPAGGEAKPDDSAPPPEITPQIPMPGEGETK
jgi:hypothetical protein